MANILPPQGASGHRDRQPKQILLPQCGRFSADPAARITVRVRAAAAKRTHLRPGTSISPANFLAPAGVGKNRESVEAVLEVDTETDPIRVDLALEPERR
jgi:hypothetical protein